MKLYYFSFKNVLYLPTCLLILSCHPKSFSVLGTACLESEPHCNSSSNDNIVERAVTKMATGTIKCFVDIDQTCMPPAQNPIPSLQGVTIWKPRTIARRHELYSSIDVQNSSVGCTQFARLLKTECLEPTPVTSVYYKNLDVIQKTDIVIGFDAFMEKNKNRLSNAFKNYFYPECTPNNAENCPIKPIGLGIKKCSSSGYWGSCVLNSCPSNYKLSKETCLLASTLSPSSNPPPRPIAQATPAVITPAVSVAQVVPTSANTPTSVTRVSASSNSNSTPIKVGCGSSGQSSNLAFTNLTSGVSIPIKSEELCTGTVATSKGQDKTGKYFIWKCGSAITCYRKPICTISNANQLGIADPKSKTSFNWNSTDIKNPKLVCRHDLTEIEAPNANSNFLNINLSVKSTLTYKAKPTTAFKGNGTTQITCDFSKDNLSVILSNIKAICGK